MSKKVSELEELLKLLGADSVEDVLMCCSGTCGRYSSYKLGINANIPSSHVHTSYYYKTIITGGFEYDYFKYIPENINENNEWEYSETFKILNTTVDNSGLYLYNTGGGYIYITEDLLKQLDGKATIYSVLTCD